MRCGCSSGSPRTPRATPAEHQLLLAIRGHHGSGEPSLSDIAAMLQLRLHSAGELVARAEDNGFVRRRPDPHDHRRALLRLTEEGEARLAELSVLHRRELRRFRKEMTDVLRELDV